LWIILLFILVFISTLLVGVGIGKAGQKQPFIMKLFLFGYIAFAGCFMFPIQSEPFPLDVGNLYSLLLAYGIIGLGFAGLYGKKREKQVYFLTLPLTLTGMICRYLLEFGEVSNTYNFTLFNIITYAVILPVYTVIAYHFISKYITPPS
jgi:hypothetical protein